MSASTTPRAQRFESSLIRPGDILLTTTPGKVSAVVRKATGSDISHAMLCVEDSSVIDSTDEGVQARNLMRFLIEPDCAAYVLRPVQALTEQQLWTVTSYARSRVGTRYTVVGAAKAILKGSAVGRRQFCSRLVAQAYREAGIQLAADADFCHPGELLDSPLLKQVEGVLREASPAEEAAWRRSEDKTQLMRDVSNALLTAARRVSAGIESINDIDEYLLANPKADEALSQALEASGYLYAWRSNTTADPWQYDIEKMEASRADPEALLDYCRRLLLSEQSGKNRYVINRGGYLALRARTGLRYFALMEQLYRHLATLHQRRVQTAIAWMTRRKMLELVSENHLRPHTPEWFASLQEWDPILAAMATKAIEIVGHAEVCSFCGDDPAHDYVLTEPEPGGPGTIRLCGDCYRIRAQEEPMRPFPGVGRS